MRYRRDVVHPSLFEATDRFSNASTWMVGGESVGDRLKAYNAHQSEWWKEYGAGCSVYGVVSMAAFIGSVVLAKQNLDNPLRAFLIIGVLLAIVGVGVALYARNRRQLTSGELKALLPALELTPIQKVYAEALVDLAELELPDETFEEVVGQLNRLLDEEKRLLALRERGVEGATREEIQGEVDVLREKLGRTDDPVTRSALERTLEIAEGRLAAARELSHLGERVDAQLAMVDQAIRGMRDGLRRLRAAPAAQGPAIDLDALRQSVDLAHQQAVSLERAVEEIRTLA
jgi:Asp-tRNA(Asn)/Glu-tRNA(Gln) amidotransferase C subunit